MMPLAPSRRCWLVVILFAVAMAWVEAASVYIRVVVDRIVPYQQNPLPVGGVLGAVELVREASTLIMLLTVGILAGRAWHERLGYSRTRIRRVGHSLLCVSQSDVRMADIASSTGTCSFYCRCPGGASCWRPCRSHC